MDEMKRKNPWLGLESYKEGEVLYGRDDDIRDLSQSVLNDTDTLLYGKSGIGKSSILNAGIIPAARRNGYQPVLIRFSHKEQHAYLEQIRHAIAQIPDLKIMEVVECKDKEQESLYEYFHRHTFHDANGERIKLLIIFDQFEEIFTLQTDEATKKRFFAELADFLNDVMPDELQRGVVAAAEPRKKMTVIGAGNFGNLFNDLKIGAENDMPEYVSDNDIHLVFTIREDFLSEFEYYSASIPSLKQNRYGLRPINEEQASQIILRPMPGLISKDVAKLIIEKVTGRTDFELDGIPEIEVDSAVLSLYLNRLYDAKTGDTITAELVEQKGGEIIADFYNDAISGISESTVEYLEDMLLNGQGRRDNITIYDAINDGGATPVELDTLCNKKKILRQFNYAGDLRIEYVHDILCPVVKAHKDERKLLKQQEEKLALIEQKNERQRRRNRNRFTVVVALLVIAAFGRLGWWLLTEKEYKASYAAFTTVDGWPVGVGSQLGDADKRQLTAYYQLVRYGYRSHNTRVNVLNSQKQLVRNKFKRSPLVSLYETEEADEKAKAFALLQRQTAYWTYTPDNDGNLFRQTAYSVNGEELYALQFFRSSSAADRVSADDEMPARKQLWATYIDRDGKSLQVRDNGADRIHIIIDDATGYYSGFRFFSETGTPQPNHEGCYGYQYQYNEDGTIRQVIPLDEFGDPQPSRAVVYTDFDPYGRWTTSASGHAAYSRQLVVYQTAHRTDSMMFNERGGLTRHAANIGDSLLCVYNYEKGRVVSSSKYRKENGGFRLFYQQQPMPQNREGISEVRYFMLDSAFHWRIERKEQRKGRLSVAYFQGSDSSGIQLKALAASKYGRYHQMVVDTLIEDSLLLVRRRYLDEQAVLSRQCSVNQELCYYNDRNEKLRHVFMRDSIVRYSYLYEYENGQMVARSVAGIDGKPIRYAGWDIDQLCYYKVKFIYNFAHTQVAVKGVNEFGEASLITYRNLEYKRHPLPATEMTEQGDAFTEHGQKIFKEIVTPLKDYSVVDYIRITSRTGTWYAAGVRDGDLLISRDARLKVARPNTRKFSYDILTFAPAPGNPGAVYYPVYFNQSETRRYLQAIGNQ